MKKITIHFEETSSPDGIEVILRANQRDEEIEALINRIQNGVSDSLTVTDDEGTTAMIQASDIITLSVDGCHHNGSQIPPESIASKSGKAAR